MDITCPFCALPKDQIVIANASALAIEDAFPVSPGHTLVISKRHVASFFEITARERYDLLQLVDAIHDRLKSAMLIDGFNIGINDGHAAGQTIPHFHIHLIPRYQGDTEDPRGGVRWIFPNKAKYWRD